MLQAIIYFAFAEKVKHKFLFLQMITLEASHECFPAAVSFSLGQRTLHIHRAAY